MENKNIINKFCSGKPSKKKKTTIKQDKQTNKIIKRFSYKKIVKAQNEFQDKKIS